jgi:hypothetical protein
MTSEVVELIEQAGLKYRTCDRTFLRRFRFSSEQDRQAVAELTLALLARIFGHSPGMSFETRVYMPTYFTRAQVRRVAALAHTLWCEMIRLVERLRVIAQARDGDVRLEHTMALRTLQIFLKGYSAEHRLWTREYMPGGPLVYQVDLKWLLQEVCDVVTRPLDALDHEVWAASRRGGGREDLESKFSSGFCSTLTTLRGVFTDWNAVADVLTRVDFYWGQGRFDGPEDSHERLAAIAARMAQRTADAEAPQLRSRTRGARRSSARPG